MCFLAFYVSCVKCFAYHVNACFTWNIIGLEIDLTVGLYCV